MTDKILIDRSVVEQALEALEMMGVPSPLVFMPDEIKSWQNAQKGIRAALEQPVEQEPDSDERVMTVVYRDPTREDVQSFMDHPKAVWFGWCHAPYQRDDARARLEQE